MRVNNHELFSIWRSIKYRCVSPKHPMYKNYGALGVPFYLGWNSFWEFVGDIEGSLGARPSKAHTLIRIDKAQGYVPGNLKWGTHVCCHRDKYGTAKGTYIGVTQDSGTCPSRPFKAQVTQGTGLSPKHLGYYGTERDAAIARDRAARNKNLEGHNLRLNFSDEEWADIISSDGAKVS